MFFAIASKCSPLGINEDLLDENFIGLRLKAQTRLSIDILSFIEHGSRPIIIHTLHVVQNVSFKCATPLWWAYCKCDGGSTFAEHHCNSICTN